MLFFPESKIPVIFLESSNEEHIQSQIYAILDH